MKKIIITIFTFLLLTLALANITALDSRELTVQINKTEAVKALAVDRFNISIDKTLSYNSGNDYIDVTLNFQLNSTNVNTGDSGVLLFSTITMLASGFCLLVLSNKKFKKVILVLLFVICLPGLSAIQAADDPSFVTYENFVEVGLECFDFDSIISNSGGAITLLADSSSKIIGFSWLAENTGLRQVLVYRLKFKADVPETYFGVTARLSESVLEITNAGVVTSQHYPLSTVLLNALQYTVTYLANDGVGSTIVESYRPGSTVTIPENSNHFTKNLHVFGYYNTKADDSGGSYYEDQVITLNSNLVLYAQYYPLAAHLIIHHYDTFNDEIIWIDDFILFPGYYGPYYPMDFIGYSIGVWDTNSDPLSGYIGPTEEIFIKFFYYPND